MGLTHLPPALAAARPDLAAAVDDANRRARQGRASQSSSAPRTVRSSAAPGANGGVRRSRRPVEREAPEQAALVAILRSAGVPFSASLAGVRLPPRLAGRAKAQGMEPGDPDLTIWATPPALPDRKGMHIEMKACELAPKTERAHRWHGARPEQKARLEMLEQHGWHCVVAYGCDDAVQKIKAAGYDLTRRRGGA